MRHWILIFCVVLGGCISTPTAKTTFPTLSYPPRSEDYVVLAQRETVEQYYAMLTIYHVYLGEYLDFIAKQYKLKHAPDPKQCLTTLKQNKIKLTELPELVGYSDDKVVDALLDHLDAVLRDIQNYNVAVDKHNQKIDQMCSGL